MTRWLVLCILTANGERKQHKETIHGQYPSGQYKKELERLIAIRTAADSCEIVKVFPYEQKEILL